MTLGRRKRILRLVDENDDDLIQKTCNRVSKQTISEDKNQIENLDALADIGSTLASKKLTLFEPKNYGVHGIHVCKELYK